MTEAGDAGHLDLVTGEFLPGEAAPLTSSPSGTVTRITSGMVTFDAGPAIVGEAKEVVWAKWRAAAFVKAARAAVFREWAVRGAIEHGGPVTLDAGPEAPSREPGNRRARRAAKARARGHRRGAEPFLGTIEAVEHGVLHVRMPDGALERLEVHDPEGWFVVGGIVTIGGAKARTR